MKQAVGAEMIDTARVLEHFCLLAECDDDEAQRWLPIAKSCAARLEARLRKGADVEENATALALAAAGMLYYQYAMAQASGDGNVRLGEITVGNGAAGVQPAHQLRDELLLGVSHLLESSGAFLVQIKEVGCSEAGG